MALFAFQFPVEYVQTPLGAELVNGFYCVEGVLDTGTCTGAG